jgi:uncharacterized membrane protein
VISSRNRVLNTFAKIALIAVYPVLIHASLVLAMPSLQVLAIITLLLFFFWDPIRRGHVLPIVAFAILSAAIVTLGYFGLTLYLLYIPPALIPFGLLVIFGRTLLPGCEPLITAIGEAARGPLSSAMRIYTKWLTRLWCLVFLVMTVWAIILPFLQQPTLWSWVTNIMSYGLVGSLFVGEFILRKHLFPEHNHPDFIEYLRIIIQYNIRQ